MEQIDWDRLLVIIQRQEGEGFAPSPAVEDVGALYVQANEDRAYLLFLVIEQDRALRSVQGLQLLESSRVH